MVFLLSRATVQNDFASGDKKNKKYVTDTLIYFFSILKLMSGNSDTEAGDLLFYDVSFTPE